MLNCEFGAATDWIPRVACHFIYIGLRLEERGILQRILLLFSGDVNEVAGYSTMSCKKKKNIKT